MNELYECIKEDLRNHDYDNRMYFFNDDTSMYYYVIKELLKKDYGYLDVVIDFSDLDKLSSIKKIPNNVNFVSLKKMIYTQYINYKILKSADIKYPLIDTEKMEQILFDDDLKKISEMDKTSFVVLDGLLNQKARECGKKNVRIHVFMNQINDRHLQMCINDLFELASYKSNIAIMAYAKKPIITDLTNAGISINDTNGFLAYNLGNEKKLRR